MSGGRIGTFVNNLLQTPFSTNWVDLEMWRDSVMAIECSLVDHANSHSKLQLRMASRHATIHYLAVPMIQHTPTTINRPFHQKSCPLSVPPILH